MFSYKFNIYAHRGRSAEALNNTALRVFILFYIRNMTGSRWPCHHSYPPNSVRPGYITHYFESSCYVLGA